MVEALGDGKVEFGVGEMAGGQLQMFSGRDRGEPERGASSPYNSQGMALNGVQAVLVCLEVLPFSCTSGGALKFESGGEVEEVDVVVEGVNIVGIGGEEGFWVPFEQGGISFGRNMIFNKLAVSSRVGDVEYY